MGFELAPDYVDVAARMRDFFQKHPEGSLQTVEIKEWWFGDQEFIAYTAAAYRTPDDLRPGYGVAWEPVPGQTPYTRNSELMNAETSAWGRAILAVGASTSKQIASEDEVRNRSGEPETAPRGRQKPARAPKGVRLAPPELVNRIEALIVTTGKYKDWDEAMVGIVGEPRGRADITFGEARNVKSTLEHLLKAPA